MAKPTVSQKQQQRRGVVVTDNRSAPFIFFDGAPSFGVNGGIVSITLAAARHLSTGDQTVSTDVVAVAHLRCSIKAAMDLRNSIDKALLLQARVSEKPS